MTGDAVIPALRDSCASAVAVCNDTSSVGFPGDPISIVGLVVVAVIVVTVVVAAIVRATRRR